MSTSPGGHFGPLDPLRMRQRPGFEVDAQSATWESTVFAITAGSSVRYLEVPANEVAQFLDVVDSGALDDELVGLASTPTGAVLNAPGRIRKLAAFDRLVRHAIARAERDPSTGQLAEPGWKPRKRQRDDEARDHTDRHADQPSQPSAEPVSATAPVTAEPSSVAAAIVPSAAKGAWWSTPMIAAGAATAVVVVIAVAAVFVITRSDDDPRAGATDGAVASASASPGAVSSTGGGSAVISAGTAGAGPASGSATADDSTIPSTSVQDTNSAGPFLTTSITGSAAESVGTESAAAPTVPANPLAGSFALVRTVTDNSGNSAIPVGQTDTGTITFTAECADPGCVVASADWGTASVSGSQVSFNGTASEVCTNDPSISVVDSWTITLQAAGQESGAVTSLQGTGTLTVSALNGCNAEIRPLTQSYSLTRTG